MANKRKFTEQMLERLRRPKTGRIELGDTVVQGLVLRVTEKGTKTFSVIYKVPGEGGVGPTGQLRTGRQHRITLGKWPTTKLKQARERARDILTEADEGIDPRVKLREHNLIRHSNSFNAVAERYVDLYARPNIKTWRNVERALRLHCTPRWADLPIRDITRGEIHEVLDELVQAKKIGAAREVRKHLRSLFGWAVERSILDANPASNLRRKELAYPDDDGHALQDFELCTVWNAAQQMGYAYGPLFQLLILTGQRTSDWALASWPEIDLELKVLKIPGQRYKTGRDHTVPLSTPVMKIVKSLPRLTGKYLFSARGKTGKQPVNGFNSPAVRLRRLANDSLKEGALEHFTVKDFRKTCRTRLTALDVSQEIAERVIGHTQDKLVRTYNRHDYMGEKRAALAKYARHIMKVVK